MKLLTTPGAAGTDEKSDINSAAVNFDEEVGLPHVTAFEEEDPDIFGFDPDNNSCAENHHGEPGIGSELSVMGECRNREVGSTHLPK